LDERPHPTFIPSPITRVGIDEKVLCKPSFCPKDALDEIRGHWGCYRLSQHRPLTRRSSCQRRIDNEKERKKIRDGICYIYSARN